MKIEKNIYFPMFASRQLNGGRQSTEEGKEIWQKIMALPDAQRNVLLSNNLAEAVAKLEEVYNVPEQFVEYVTVTVREMFFGNFSEQEVLRAFRAQFAKLPHLPLDEVIQYIQLSVFKAGADPEEVEEEEEEVGSVVAPENVKQMTLLDGLAKYPNLTNQVITSENIKLKNQAAPVRPSISNWLKVYREELGIGLHNAVARAKFLFESPNTKKLSSPERERIHAILRSMEDDETMDIDPARQEIVFLNEQKERVVSVSPSRPSSVSAASPDIFERFQNIPAREELKNVGTQTFVGEKPATEKVSEKKNNEEDVLSRIKNMLVTPVSANAPAPKEDFIQASEARQALPTEEPLGTLRFSAKHVLPAERQNQLQASGINAAPSRLEHFRPQEVVIPGSQETSPRPLQSTGPQYTVHTAKAEPATISNYQPAAAPLSSQPSLPPSPKTAVPASGREAIPAAPPSIFRIKPSKN